MADYFAGASPAGDCPDRAKDYGEHDCEVLRSKLEQVVDVQRCAEVLFLQLIASGVIDEADRCDIHARQQQKCIDHGHHKVEVA